MCVSILQPVVPTLELRLHHPVTQGGHTGLLLMKGCAVLFVPALCCEVLQMTQQLPSDPSLRSTAQSPLSLSLDGERGLPTSSLFPSPTRFPGFPGVSAGKESACNAGDLGSIPGLGRSPGEWKGYPLQHSGLENSMDSIVHGVAKSQTRLSDFHPTSRWVCLKHNRAASLSASTFGIKSTLSSPAWQPFSSLTRPLSCQVTLQPSFPSTLGDPVQDSSSGASLVAQ